MLWWKLWKESDAQHSTVGYAVSKISFLLNHVHVRPGTDIRQLEGTNGINSMLSETSKHFTMTHRRRLKGS